MGICLLSAPTWRTATGEVGEGAERADEVRAIAVRSITAIEVKIMVILSDEKKDRERNDVPPLKAFFLKSRATSNSSSVRILMFSGCL